MGSTPHYGLDAELRAKQAAKYDQGLEDSVRDWIEQVIGQASGDQSMAAWLKDGQVLCALANAIKPGLVAKVNTSKLPFKQMENITFFMNAARDVGVPESSMFGTPDLFEEKNMGSVMSCVYAFAGVAQVACPDFAGPHLGQAQQPDVKDRKRAAGQVTQSGGFAATLQAQKASTLARDITSGAQETPAAAAAGYPRPSSGAAVGGAGGLHAEGPAADAPSLDADLRAKQAAKFDAGLERDVCDWIEQVTGERKGDVTTHEWLKSGQVLCVLANAVRPGLVKKINSGSMPFKQMENITFFMNAARDLGVPESSMFGTPDLYEDKNMGSVISCIYAFGGAVQIACPAFKGPALGPALKVEAKDKKREGTLVTSQYEAMQRTMERERPKDSGIIRGGH